MWAAQEEGNKKAKKDSIIAEDPPQLKNPPELELLLPAVPACLDPAVVIPPSTETEHESTELWAAQEEEENKQKRTASSLKILPSLKILQSWECCCQWSRV